MTDHLLTILQDTRSGRFDEIVESLHEKRISVLEASRKKRSRGKRLSSPRKKKEKMTFDSPELERIFMELPEDMKEMLRRGKKE